MQTLKLYSNHGFMKMKYWKVQLLFKLNFGMAFIHLFWSLPILNKNRDLAFEHNLIPLMKRLICSLPIHILLQLILHLMSFYYWIFWLFIAILNYLLSFLNWWNHKSPWLNLDFYSFLKRLTSKIYFHLSQIKTTKHQHSTKEME